MYLYKRGYFCNVKTVTEIGSDTLKHWCFFQEIHHSFTRQQRVGGETMNVKGHGRGKQLSPALQGQQVSEFFQLCVWATDLKQCSQI